jgi:hypothetical protein
VFRFESLLPPEIIELTLIPFAIQVVPEVEVWLMALSREMKSTLQQLLVECVTQTASGKEALNPSVYPSQVRKSANNFTQT